MFQSFNMLPKVGFLPSKDCWISVNCCLNLNLKARTIKTLVGIRLYPDWMLDWQWKKGSLKATFQFYFFEADYSPGCNCIHQILQLNADYKAKKYLTRSVHSIIWLDEICYSPMNRESLCWNRTNHELRKWALSTVQSIHSLGVTLLHTIFKSNWRNLENMLNSYQITTTVLWKIQKQNLYDISSNQRPASVSRYHSRPIRGQYLCGENIDGVVKRIMLCFVNIEGAQII